MALFPIRGAIPASVPVSTYDMERWVAKHRTEQQRARTDDSPIRETWHTDRMDAWLDALLERGYGSAA